jgi:CubicO group peptidase (beta-lactamase class C family)
MERLGRTAQHLRPTAISASETTLPSMGSAAADLGVDLEPLWSACEELVAHGAAPGYCVAVARHGKLLPPRAFGHAGPEAGERDQGLVGGMSLVPDSIFLVASVTKPVVATAVLQLVQRGQLDLDATVSSLIPAFGTSAAGSDDRLVAERATVTVRHLLTHTSGLPDAVPENHALREREAPLRDFSAIMIHAPLLFTPGTDISYSSVALNVLGDIVESIAETSLGEFVKANIFSPLGMADTQLGIGADRNKSREVCLNLAGDYGGADSGRAFQHLPASEGGIPTSNWNSDYWRGLGAPWGGMTTTVADLAVFCQSILGNVPDKPQLLSRESVALMTATQTHGPAPAIATLSEEKRSKEIYGGKLPSSWGLGWRVNHPGSELKFGNSNPGRTYGHHGAVRSCAISLHICVCDSQVYFGGRSACT